MKYEKATDMEERVKEVISKLRMDHVEWENISCIRSFGSTSNAIARCHALGKVMQLALERRAFYVLEFVSEKFDSLPEDEKTRVIIHELMHIPKSFGGGFRHHDFVNRKNVETLYREFQRQNNSERWKI